MERIFGLSGDEVVDEVRGKDKADTITAQAGQLTHGIGKMRFSHSGGTEENAVGFVANKVEGGGAMDEVTRNALRVIEVVGIQRGEGEDGGAAQRDFSALLQTNPQLLTH